MIELNEEILPDAEPKEKNQKDESDEAIDYNDLKQPNYNEQEKLIEFKCRMNQNYFTNIKEVSYICRSCPNKMKNLCRYCIEVCHKSHIMNIKIDQLREDVVCFLNNPCSCALNNHKVAQFNRSIDKQDSHNRENKSYCHLNALFSLINPKYFYKAKEDNKTYCLFCILNKNDEDGPITKEKFYSCYEKCTYSSSYPYCSCENEMHKHEIPIENLNNFIVMFSDLSQTLRLNMLRLSYQFFASKKLNESFLTEFIYIQAGINDTKFKEKGLIANQMRAMEIEQINLEDKMDWDLFFKTDQLLHITAKQLKKIKTNCLNDDFSSFYNYENTIFILKAQSNLGLNLLKIQKANASMFRRFNTINYSNSDYLYSNSNISPIHRLLLSPVKNEEQYSQLQNIIEALFSILNEMEDAKKIPQNDMNGMFNETLKYIKRVIVYYQLNKEELMKTCHQIESLMFLFKDKKEGQGKVLKTLQEIIDIIFTYLNDIVIFEKFIRPKEADKQNEIKETFHYCFQQNDDNKQILKTLFTFDGQLNEDIEYINNKMFYDNFVNQKDWYIESTNSIIRSPQMEKLLDNDIDYIDLIQGNISSLYKMNNHIEDDIKRIASIFNDFYSITKEMLNNIINEFVFLEKIKDKYDELHNRLSNGLLNEYTEKNVFKSQLLFFKLGSFSQMKDLMHIVNKIVSYCLAIDGNSQKEINKISEINITLHEKFKNILLLLIQGNPFIAAILLTKENISLILDKDTYNLDLYVLIGQLGEEYEYSLNFEELIDYIHSNYRTFFKNLKVNFKQIEMIFKIYTYILTISTEKSIYQSNNVIGTHLSNILESTEFMQIVKNNANNEREENDTELVHLVLTCVIHLKKEYFYLINSMIDIKPIIDQLEDISIPPQFRIVLFQLYSCYFLESYFSLVSHSQFYLNESTVSINVIDNSDVNNNKKIKDKCSFLFHRRNNSLLSKEEIILAPVISNLEKFKYYYLHHEKNFNKSFPFLLSYFNEVIFLPTIYSIYKITYLAQDLTARLKYSVYNIICLFLQCYQYLLEDIEAKYDMKKKDNENTFNKYFSKNITVLVKTVKESFDKLNSPKVQLLNLKLMITLFLDNVKMFRVYQDRFSTEEENNNNPIQNNDNNSIDESNNVCLIQIRALYQSLKEAYSDYVDIKSQYNDDNVFNDIFSEENYLEIQQKITYDLLLKLNYPPCESSKLVKLKDEMRYTRTSKADLLRFDLGEYSNEFINTYKEEKTSIIETVDKLFKSNPEEWQKAIVKKVLFTKNIINIFIEKQLPILIQFIFIEYNRIDSSETYYYKSYLLFLEFLRLLCEDHNPIFQTMLINYEQAVRANAEEKLFISFVCRLPCMILNNIKHASNKSDILKNIKHYDNDYFKPLIGKVTDFLIELIQGTYTENFEDLTTAKDLNQKIGFVDYYNKHYQFMDYLESYSEYEYFVGQFIRFLNCFIEENSNPTKIKIPVIIKLNPKKLISTAVNSFKKLMHKYVNKIITSDSHKELLDLFINSDPDLIDDPLFAISTGIFIYLKRVNSNKVKEIGDKYQSIIDDLNDLAKDQAITEDNSIKMIQREFYLFCDKLIKDTEICFTQDQSRDEKELYSYKNFFSTKYKKNVLEIRNSNCNKKIKHDNIFFAAHPDSLFLENNDTMLFLEKADYTNFNTKLNCILKHYPELSILIEIRKTFQTRKMMLSLYQIHYGRLEVYNAIVAFIICLLLVLSKEGNTFESMIIPVSCVHLSIVFLIVTNWFVFHTMIEYKFKSKSVSFTSLVYFFASSIFDLEIFCFCWSLFWGIPAVLFKNLRFLFSLQLFVIFNLFPTMRSVLFAIQVRYKQFLSTAFLLVILILFYAAVTFYFFNVKDDGEQLCSSYLECFLYLFNSGIRAGGVPFEAKIEEQPGFWSEFFFSWVFYFIIILIILNIVNGIIVDTFQALREQNNEIDDGKRNVCFVCSLHRANFEIKGIDFDHHIIFEHNVENYFNYLIKVLKTDSHDLNSTDFEVYNSIKSNKIEFFPIKKAKSLNDVI